MSTLHLLTESLADQFGEADGTDPEHLERVPDAQNDQEMEPARSAVFDEFAADGGAIEVGAGEEHRGYAPFQAATSVDRVAQDVRWKPRP